ncbi:MAG: GNAT family N-acetyltransferase [Alphaproteobacteria bacterium]
MTSVLIRPARPEDGRAIARVHVEAWRDAYAGILPAGYLVRRIERHAAASLPRPSAATGRSGRRSATLVAELDAVVGYVTFGPARHVADPATGEIAALYVRPDAQGRGLGRALVETALQRQFAAGCRAVEVEVLAENPARHFYTAMGAKLVGEGAHRFAGRMLPVAFYRWAAP